MKGIIDVFDQDFITDESGPKITVEDLENALRELWSTVPSEQKTIMFYPDGYHEPGEPDTDDVPLAAGDLVAWSVLRSSLFKKNPIPERIPYKLGIVQSVEPWDESLSGMVYVRFGNGWGAWKERDQLKKMEWVEATSTPTPPPSHPAPDDSSR